MIWVSPFINLVMWTVYLVSAFGCIYFFAPQWGGWKSLDIRGKACAIPTAIICGVAAYGLVTTSVMPL